MAALIFPGLLSRQDLAPGRPSSCARRTGCYDVIGPDPSVVLDELWDEHTSAAAAIARKNSSRNEITWGWFYRDYIEAGGGLISRPPRCNDRHQLHLQRTNDGISEAHRDRHEEDSLHDRRRSARSCRVLQRALAVSRVIGSVS